MVVRVCVPLSGITVRVSIYKNPCFLSWLKLGLVEGRVGRQSRVGRVKGRVGAGWAGARWAEAGWAGAVGAMRCKFELL